MCDLEKRSKSLDHDFKSYNINCVMYIEHTYTLYRCRYIKKKKKDKRKKKRSVVVPVHLATLLIGRRRRERQGTIGRFTTCNMALSPLLTSTNYDS